jgi:hypothetical protein
VLNGVDVGDNTTPGTILVKGTVTTDNLVVTDSITVAPIQIFSGVVHWDWLDFYDTKVRITDSYITGSISLYKMGSMRFLYLGITDSSFDPPESGTYVLSPNCTIPLADFSSSVSELHFVHTVNYGGTTHACFVKIMKSTPAFIGDTIQVNICVTESLDLAHFNNSTQNVEFAHPFSACWMV